MLAKAFSHAPARAHYTHTHTMNLRGDTVRDLAAELATTFSIIPLVCSFSCVCVCVCVCVYRGLAAGLGRRRR